MTWIATISYEDAMGALKKLYDRIKGPDDNVDNIMLAHSLRPHSMEGHMALYKYVLHHPRNVLPKSYLETIGVYVSLLNKCRYCVDHHYGGLLRLIEDDVRSAEIRAALDAGSPAAVFDGKELAGLLRQQLEQRLREHTRRVGRPRGHEQPERREHAARQLLHVAQEQRADEAVAPAPCGVQGLHPHYVTVEHG